MLVSDRSEQYMDIDELIKSGFNEFTSLFNLKNLTPEILYTAGAKFIIDYLVKKGKL